MKIRTLRPFSLAIVALVLGLLVPASLQSQDLTDQLALQTWTMRKLSFEEMTDFAVKIGISDLELWSNSAGGHINPLAPWEEIEQKKKVLDSKGLKVYAFGVTNAIKNEEQLRKTFELARYMGMEMIIVEPREKRELDLLEKFAAVYDIKVAVHNHTIDSPFGNPVTVKMLLADRDPRVGICLDAGWMTTTGRDVAEVYKEYGDRVFDIHLKDKLIGDGNAQDHSFKDVAIGTGDTNFPGLFDAMKESGYSGRLAIETDQELQDPTDFVKGAIAYVEQNGR